MDREVRVEGHRLIRAPLHRVWQLLSRLESHPRYTDLWLSADLLERSQGSAVVEFRGFFGGLPVTSVQRMTLRPPGRIEFKQVRGTLRALAGFYVLKEVDGDTDLHLQLAVDAGIALFSEAAVQQILAGHIDVTLTRLKASAERDLVRLQPRRTAPAGLDEQATAAGEPARETGAGEVEVEPPSGEPAGDEQAAPAGVAAGGGAAPASAARGGRRRRRRRHRRGSGPRPPTPQG
jgi:hypothetical protein